MKRTMIIAVCLLALAGCTKKSSTSTPAPGTPGTSGDSTFNGSYFQIAYNGKNFMCKDVVHKSGTHYNMLQTNSNVISAGNTIIQVALTLGISGISSTMLYFHGNGSTGSYNQSSLAGIGYTSLVVQTSPFNSFSDTSGTANITHAGTDYLEGSFSINLYTTAGLTYPATGSFKIYH